jgi:hypothetical protein
MLAFWTCIGCSLVFLTDTDSQHPFQISALIALLTLKYSSTAAGVTVMLLAGIVAPSIVIAREISSTVPPVGTEILAPKSIR